MSIADEVERLEQLHRNGTLSDEEFAKAKERALQQPGSVFSSLTGGPPLDPAQSESQTRTWAMILHLSQLLAYPTVGVGFIAPIIIWLVMKNSLPGIDQHGKIVANWLLSALIYGVVGGILLFVFIGFPLLIALSIATVVFPIIGGLKASQGDAWKYPLSITFFV